MNKKQQKSAIPNIVSITAATLNMAIVELKSGDTDLCLDTLTSLERILLEFTRMETSNARETEVRNVQGVL